MKSIGITKEAGRAYRRSRWIAVLAAAMVMTAGCSLPGGPPGGPAEALLQVRAVKTEDVVKRSISSPVEQVADAVSGTTFDVVPKVGGTVVEVLKKRGETVQKGDILLRLDSTDAESAKRKNELSVRTANESLKKAKDDQVNNRKELSDAVERAKVTLKNAEQDYNKIRNDYDEGKATEHQVELSKQQMDNARMSLESAQNKLSANDNSNTIASYESQAESARLTLEDSLRSLENYQVVAPASGILTDFTPEAGQTISAGKLGQVQQVNPIKLKTELSETNFQLVKGKKELVFYHPDTPQTKRTASISYLAPIMSAQTKTFTLELEVPNPDLSIQAGTRYMVQLTTEQEEQVIAVPTLSIIREESDAFVFVQQGDTYHKKKITIGRINGQYQEVLDGLKEGEKLVVTGQHQLKDGQKAEADKPASAAPAGKPQP